MSMLTKLFAPNSIAIIGATVRSGAIGNTVVRNFRISNYRGQVYPINSRYTKVEGYKCYPTILDIENGVDLAILALPSEYIEQAVIDCNKQGISNLLIFSSGFAETGEEGRILQDKIVAYCKQHHMRILGPNTLGMINIHEDLALMFQDIGYTVYKKGSVGLVAQSGATGSQVLSMASEEQVGFSYMVATGNQPDIDTIEVLDFFIEDENTTVGAFYMESVSSGTEFLRMAEKALKMKKPIIGIKSGKSEAGQKAAMSHTASLTGSSEIFQVAAKKYGVSLVDGFDPLIDALKALQVGKYPQGDRVASVVVSGAVGILLADALESNGLKMAELTSKTKDKLREEVASYCSVENPVDIASTFILNEKVYSHTVQTLVEAEEVDIIFVHLPVPTALNPMKFASMFIEIAKKTNKPIFVLPTGMEQEMGSIRQYLTDNGVPSYRSIEAGVQTAKIIYDYYLAFNEYENEETTEVTEVVTFNNRESNIVENEVKKIMQNAGIPIPKGMLLKSENDIEKVQLDYPLVAKVSSVEIMHKSDVGGIVLKIESAYELKVAYKKIINNVKRNCPHAVVQGIYVEEMAHDNFVEFFVGIQNDPLFGPVVTCGLGGIFIEILKDVSRNLAPISLVTANKMIEELKAVAILNGARTNISYDIEALAQAITQLSQLALRFEQGWTDFEVNPLVVFEKGKGVLALDGLINLQVEQSKVH